jgi:hypothetical protein
LKRCYKCGIEKPKSEFYKDKTTRDGLSNKCKSCSSITNREWRTKHKEHLLEYRKDWREHNIDKTLQYAKNGRVYFQNKIKSYKTKCVKCGEDRDYVIDFHHINNNEKLFNINTGRGRNQESLVSEVNKCVCLCRNCHSEFHHLYGNVPSKPIESLTEYLGKNPYELTPNIRVEVSNESCRDYQEQRG